MMDQGNLDTVEKMWRREVEAATTYRHLASRETDPKRKAILVRLAEQEEKHAARWAAGGAAAAGAGGPDRRGVGGGLSGSEGFWDRGVVLQGREGEKKRAKAESAHLMPRLYAPADRLIAEEAMLEERDHAVVLR